MLQVMALRVPGRLKVRVTMAPSRVTRTSSDLASLKKTRLLREICDGMVTSRPTVYQGADSQGFVDPLREAGLGALSRNRGFCVLAEREHRWEVGCTGQSDPSPASGA